MTPTDELSLMDLAEMYLNPACPSDLRRIVGERLLATADRITEEGTQT